MRGDTLKHSVDRDLVTQKRALLNILRADGVCVLEKGAIEDYYPQGITGEGKPARAQCFCNTVTKREDALSLCAKDFVKVDGSLESEFGMIFEVIFRPHSAS